MKRRAVMQGWLLFVLLVQTTAAQQPVLTTDEKAGILFMREEEKLARDIYDSMFIKWNTNPFENIRLSERVHMQEMKELIDVYKLVDPVEKTKDKPGSFENTTLKKYYDELIKKGSSSFVEALKAGAFIEEIDLRDLESAKSKTTNTTIITAYDYLIMGSENHLRAFYRRLKNSGVNYEPVILSIAAFKKIIEE